MINLTVEIIVIAAHEFDSNYYITEQIAKEKKNLQKSGS